MRVCPRCGEENPERARFCLNCGEPMAEAEDRRRERKFATALFADLVGSTSLAEREDPEVVQEVVGRAFDRLAEEVDRYEGLLEKFMGDAILAVFGVPRAHEDDPERAVRAAIEMQAVLSELNHGFAAEGKPRLEMRIGVEAGEVLVDVDRASGPRHRMLTGDAVNTAARLQTAAAATRVVVGPSVFTSTKDAIEYRELPALELKGKAEPVPSWEALRVKAKQRGERPQLGMEAKLIGRDEELAVLKQTFLRVQNEGRPALVTVVGPAGVGKTRLARELERHVEAMPEFVYWRRGRCLAYGNTSYSALADAIKAQCEIFEDDAADVAVKKTENAVRELFGNTDIAPEIGALVGAGEPGSFSREDLFEAWRRFLERMAARYPLVLMFEDIQWADEGLLDFIEHVADWAQGPILVATLARPELFDTRPTWGGGKRNAASISLEPLSPDESSAMLDDLLAGGLTAELRRTIAARSEGNPLYVEEIVRKLIDDGVLRATGASTWEIARPVDDVVLPRSIHGLVAARLDVLPEDEKAVLQDAAVVGRVFWTGAVARLGGRSVSEVRDALGRLRVKELVLPNEPSSFSDEHEFTFRHALIRDSAYDSLPKSLRAQKHAQVARWAEERAGDRADDIAELIATHDLEALRYLEELGDTSPVRTDAERAAYRWVRAAGDRATALWLPDQGIRWYVEASRLAESIGAPVADRAPLARALTRVSYGSAPTPQTEERCRHALALFEAAGDDLGAGWAESLMTMIQFQQGRDAQALEFGGRAIARLEPLGDTSELADAYRILGQFHWRRGHTEEAERLLRRAIDVASRVDARAVLAAATQDLAVTLSQTGQSGESLAIMEEAFHLAKEAGDPINLQRAYNNMASILTDFGSDFRRAQDIAREGLEFAKKGRGLGWMAWVGGTLGEISLRLGDLNDAEARTREAIENGAAAGDAPLVGMRHMVLARILLLRGRIDEAAVEAGLSAEILRDKPEPQAEIPLAGVSGFVAQAQGRDDQALEHLRRGADMASEYTVDADPWLLLELVRLLIRIGDHKEARLYRDVLARAEAPFAIANLRAASGLLADDPAAAGETLGEALELFESLGTRIDLGRTLLDLGRAQRRAGEDPEAVFTRARRLFLECDALLFVPEADAELAGGG
jgi:class 3 adenylate cyclase/tetratricopeptide (TPR) repeat protein